MIDSDALMKVAADMMALLRPMGDRLVLTGSVYSGYGTFDFSITRDGSPVKLPPLPPAIEQSHRKLIALRHVEPFSNNPFNHYRFVLTLAGEVNFSGEMIDENDAFPGLYMRRVSELSEGEADSLGIPASRRATIH